MSNSKTETVTGSRARQGASIMDPSPYCTIFDAAYQSAGGPPSSLRWPFAGPRFAARFAKSAKICVPFPPFTRPGASVKGEIPVLRGFGPYLTVGSILEGADHALISK